MNKVILLIYIFCSCAVWSQANREKPTLENFQKKYKYVKSKKYDGPVPTYDSPTEIGESEDISEQSSTTSNGGAIDYSPEDIDRIRKRKLKQREWELEENGKGGGYGDGNKPRNPEMGKPDPIEFNPPPINPPKVDLPDVDPPMFSTTFWRTILIILVVIVILFIIYYLSKNYKPKNKKVVGQSIIEEWNPELITKSELELKLEQAKNEKNYRECVRIYFTFILKEMIDLRLIRWKKELTNYDYLLQIGSTSNYSDFQKTVHIYDLVWYGEYQIDSNDFERLERHLKKHYEQLTAAHA